MPTGRRPGPWPRLPRRVPLVACCALLAALPFATAPGDIIADTKFELAVDPSRFLSSALTLWNPQQFGGLADQYVGYLFPMGPFFELARLLTVPGWVAQRLWLAALLLIAFTGVVRLAGRLAIGTPGTRTERYADALAACVEDWVGRWLSSQRNPFGPEFPERTVAHRAHVR